MNHIHKPGTEDRAFVLFHGTGGGPRDLMGIASAFDPDAHVIGLEGDVDEQGMKRFFKRLRPGVFDEDDLVLRAHALDGILESLGKRYGVSVSRMVLIGYSNGANIIAAYLSLYGKRASGAFLFQPMRPFKDVSFGELVEYPVFISSGENDPIVPVGESRSLIRTLEDAHARLHVRWHDDGHALSEETLEEARTFFRTHWT